MKDMTAQEMMEQAKTELGNLAIGTTFLVKDLFKGYSWNFQEIPVRLTLGTLFLNYARQNTNMIEVLEKNSANQQKYKRI